MRHHIAFAFLLLLPFGAPAQAQVPPLQSGAGCAESYKFGAAYGQMLTAISILSTMEANGETCASGRGCLDAIGNMNTAIFYINDYFDNNHDWDNECMRCAGVLPDVFNFTDELTWVDLWFEDRGYHNDPNFRNYELVPGSRANIPLCPQQTQPVTPVSTGSQGVPLPAGTAPVVANAGVTTTDAMGDFTSPLRGGESWPDGDPETALIDGSHVCIAHLRDGVPRDALWTWYSMMGVGRSDPEIDGILCASFAYITFDGASFVRYDCPEGHSETCTLDPSWRGSVTEVVQNDDGSVSYYYETPTGGVGWAKRQPG